MFGYYNSSYGGSDPLSGYYVIGAFVALFAVSWIVSTVSSYIEKKAQELSEARIASRKAEIDNYVAQRKKEADQYQKQIHEETDQYQKRVRKEADQHYRNAIYEIEQKQNFLDETRSQLNTGYVAGRRWLATFIAEAEAARDKVVVNYLRNKSRPARSAAEQVKEAIRQKKEATGKLKFLEYQIISYKEYFPVLAEYEDIILEEFAGFKKGAEIDDPDEEIDRSALYLSKEEYLKLPVAERNQRALDAYKARNKFPWEVGRMYERYLGYLYEMEGWDVTFHGALAGFEDMGRDLICTKNEKVHIVQAKCWSKDKVIHEKHLFQLYGTCLLYELTQKTSVTAIFAATTELSDVAAMAAKKLKVVVKKQKFEQAYPHIKCNINQGERIYHLPFDQQYDRVKIRPSDGEFYALTVSDAEAGGFRRAKRYMPQSSE